MKKDEIPTPGGVRTYWAVDDCLAVDITEGDKDEDPKRVL